MSTDTKPLDEVKREYEEKIRRISSFFEEARRYQTAKRSGAPLATDLKLEAMLPVLERNVPLLVNVDREQPIRDAIAWAEQQKVNVVLAGIRQPGKAVELLAQKKIPVILGETLSLPETEDAPYDEQYALPALLYKAGVKFAFGSFDNQFARNLPYQAANAVAYGLPMEAALRSITINAAEIWGVAKEIGSIEEGKSADLVLADGDLLSARTKVVNVFIKGQEAGTSSKHTELYEKYKGRK